MNPTEPSQFVSFSDKQKHRQSIALVTMTKNGIEKLKRLFPSVVGFVDRAVVLDTGSTDGTIDWLKEQKFFPVSLHQFPFINFEVNRNLLMKSAQGAADWLLLLDDDMGLTFEKTPDEIRASLNLGFGAYLLMHDHSTIIYWVGRLVRGDRLWRYRGVTHEYLEGSGAGNPRLEGVKVWHNYNHGPEKFTRDLQLLTADIARDPNDVRTIFYIANTLRDMGQTEAAIRFYRMRSQMGGWEEEVYYSLYEAARLAKNPEWMKKAAAFRSSRAEAPAWLSLYYQFVEKDSAQSKCWENVRAEIPLSKDVLFVNLLAYGPNFSDKLASIL
jgi:glycosyltransferase involved in cell wall biosynthesis